MREKTTQALWLIVALGGMGVTQAQAFQGNANNGREIYQLRCTHCHGVDGRGNNGMAADFRAEWHRLTKSDAALMRGLRNGVSTPGRSYSAGVCPPHALSENEMSDVLSYLRSAFLQ